MALRHDFLRSALLLGRCNFQLVRFTSSSGSVRLAFNKYSGSSGSEHSNMEPLVILHGLFGQKQNWHSVSMALQKQLGCIVFAVDLRNHGDSPWTKTMSYEEMADDVKAFIDETVTQETKGRHSKVHLLGHSMGGKTAMHVALSPDAPSRLASLIVEDVAPRAYDLSSHRSFPEFIKAMKAADLSGSRSQISQQLSVAVPDLTVRQFLLTNLCLDGHHKRWKLNLDSIGQELEQICGVNLPESTFQNSSLFISGSLSPYVTPGDHKTILKKFPNAKFVVVEGSGHWVHAEKPYKFMEEVVRFLNSLRSKNFLDQ